jgi:hypothetical protein
MKKIFLSIFVMLFASAIFATQDDGGSFPHPSKEAAYADYAAYANDLKAEYEQKLLKERAVAEKHFHNQLLIGMGIDGVGIFMIVFALFY